MASKNFQRKVNDAAWKLIKKQCVAWDPVDLYELKSRKDWCQKNVGFRCENHPLIEFSSGNKWINNGRGDWAFHAGAINHQFWFARSEDRIAFILTFSD